MDDKPWAGKTDPLSQAQWALEQSEYRVVTYTRLCDQLSLALKMACRDLHGGDGLVQHYRRAAAEELEKNPLPFAPYGWTERKHTYTPYHLKGIKVDNENAYCDGTDTMAGDWKPGSSGKGKTVAVISVGAIFVWLIWLAI